MNVKSILVLGASNFIAFSLLQKLSVFSYYRVAAADFFKSKYIHLLSNNILFEEVSNKQQILKKYQFDIIIDFLDDTYLNLFLQNKDEPDITIKISNCYGPHQNENAFLTSLIVSSFNQDFLRIYKDGSLLSDFIHVDDATDALLKIMHLGEKTNYEISSGIKYKDVDIARSILKKMQLPMTLIEYETLEKDNLDRSNFDNSKLSKLGWRPKISIDTGLDLIIKWLEENNV